MKRTLAIVLTVALVGGLLFMGTAAAQAENELDQEQELDLNAENTADIAQDQTQVNANSLTGETNDAPLIQVQQTDQTNFGQQEADVDQEIEQEPELEQEIEDVVQRAFNYNP